MILTHYILITTILASLEEVKRMSLLVFQKSPEKHYDLFIR